MLDVDLVDDAGARRDDLEVVEGALAPTKELVALAVALVLDLDVALERFRGAEDVGDHGVVDDHFGRRQRVDLRWVAAEVDDRLTHRGEVDDTRDTGEVLHDHAGRRELDLRARLGVRIPAGQRLDVILGDVGAVLGPQQRLEQDLQAERQAGDVEPFAGHPIQSEIVVGLSPDLEGFLGVEAVDGHADLQPLMQVSDPILPRAGSRAQPGQANSVSSNPGTARAVATNTRDRRP